jgi:LCP family protein required for cell wall assembly
VLQRGLKVVVALLSVVVLAVSVGGYAVVTWFNGSINRVHIDFSASRPAAPPAGTQNWLLVGTDSRAGTNGEYGTVEGQRSDTTILAHLDADGTTTMVSFPRDTLVEIPDFRSSNGKFIPKHMDKFNSALLEGGPSLLVQTIQNMTQIRIDHYVSVDLEGFSEISKALNGVKVCIKPSPYTETGPDGGTITNINDGYSGFHGVYGEQTVAGQSAVAFVRQRHGLPNGDIDRIKRQQQFLGSVFRAASQTGVLFNPVAITHLLTALRDALTLDQDTSLTDLEKLAVRMRGVGTNQIFFETIPQRGLTYQDSDLGYVFEDSAGILELTPTGQSKSVGSVQILEKPEFEAMMAKLRNETPTTALTAPATTPSVTPSREPVPVAVPPSQIVVTVQNGSGRSGLAEQVTAALGQDGFRTGVPGPAASTGYANSEVHYSADAKSIAETVAAAVPGTKLVEDGSVTNGVVLIVGANYKEVRPVTVSNLPTPTPTPTETTPTPTVTTPPVTADSESNRCTY